MRRCGYLAGLLLWAWFVAPAIGKVTPPAGARTDEARDGWFAPKSQTDTPALPKSVDRAFVIPIREPISAKTYKALRRKALRSRKASAQLVILDVDTWGGDAIAALDIARLLKKDLGDVYVLCYVHTRAISAGALIALACDEIVMNPTGKLGDCAPIVMGGKLEGVEREKIETVLRTEFEESAQRNGYNVALATSMVSHDQEVWLVRNRKTHELRYVLAGEYQSKVANAPQDGEKKTKPPRKTEWEFLEVVLAEGKLLTMTPGKALEYGFASRIVKAPEGDPYAGLLKPYHLSRPPVVLEDTWSEDLVDVLTHPVVAGILVFLTLLFGYTEMHTPGFGVFGAIAIFCLVVLLAGQYLVGLAEWWELAVFGLGILLLLAEIVFIPGFGVAGISGIVLIIVALLAMFVPNAPDTLPIPHTPLAWDMLQNGVLALCLGFLGFLLAAAVLSRFLPKWSLVEKCRLVLAPSPAATDAPRPDNSPMLHIRPGATGVTETPLHPVGRVWFGEDLLDAVSEGGLIARGRRVRVLRRDGNRIIVEEEPT